MAQKFNNGEKLGVVRNKLNGNADEIDQLAIEVGKKVTAIEGKGLSTNDYTNAEKAKVEALASQVGGGEIDLSGYQPIIDGKSLVSDTEIEKLAQINPANLVVKDGDKVLSDVNFALTDKQKLDGITPNATNNATNVQLRDRSTHTGSQAISTINNLQTELNNRPPTTSGSPVKPTGIWYGTQAQYDALPTKTATFKYEIYEA